MAESPLFRPFTLGNVTLSHRIVMAPLTRFRCTDANVPQGMNVEYYSQRASTPGTLMIGEATMISPLLGDFPFAPGIWNQDQIDGWRTVTDAVHQKGYYLFCQLNAAGRAAKVFGASVDRRGNPLLSSSPIRVDETRSLPQEMSEGQIWQAIRCFAQAAKNAISAGFDGVEIHGANGYLVDQFTQDVCNQRTDSWGGSIENRGRFGFEVASAVAAAIGPERVGFRISPYSTYNGMLMDDPRPGFAHLVTRLKELKLGYLHIIEPRVSNFEDVETRESIEYLMEIWNGMSPILCAGGYTAELANTALSGSYSRFQDVAIVFGRHFVANPDLVQRVKEGWPLTKHDRASFYTPGETKGYTDYACYEVPATAHS